MDVCYYVNSGKYRQEFADLVSRGCAALGVHCSVEVPGIRSESCTDWVSLHNPSADVAFCLGVKGNTHKIIDVYRARGRHCIVIDKGYVRHGEPTFWSLNIDAMRPGVYAFEHDMPGDRWDAIMRREPPLRPLPFRTDGEFVMLLGSSPKGMRFFDHEFFVGRPLDIDTVITVEDKDVASQRQAAYFESIASRLVELTQRPIYYRGRTHKSPDRFNHPTVIRDARDCKIEDALRNCWCAVSHTSNAGFNALFNGIPVIELGIGVARVLASARLEDVENPHVPTWDERQRWLRQLAYCQWTKNEIADGQALRHIFGVIEELRTRGDRT